MKVFFWLVCLIMPIQESDVKGTRPHLLRAWIFPSGLLIHVLPFLLLFLSPQSPLSFLTTTVAWASCYQPSSSWQVWLLPALDFGHHKLGDFSPGPWNAWWLTCRIVLGQGSSGCWQLSLSLCHLSQFLTDSLSAQKTLELWAPSRGSGCCLLSCLLDRFFLRTPAMWLSVIWEQHLEIVSRGLASRGRCVFRLAVKQTCHTDFLLCQKPKEQEWCFLQNKQQQQQQPRTPWVQEASQPSCRTEQETSDIKTVTL